MDRPELTQPDLTEPDLAHPEPLQPAPAQHRFVATAPRGLTDLLARELGALGAVELRERPAGVLFGGSLAVGYRACLWSRVASRILLQLTEFNAASTEDFYAAVRAFDWQEHIDPQLSIACEFTGRHAAITHTHFGALRLKDGICDQLRAATGSRPDVQLNRPAVRLHAHANGSQITLSLDMAGESLHRRGYRLEAGEAPLRENVAAGVLLRAGWPALAASGAAFLDPMCGSGTLPIEAAMIAAERAPGLQRTHFGFLGWRQHDAALWEALKVEARERARTKIANVLRGSDIDARVLTDAMANAKRAGVAELVQFDLGAVADARPLVTAVTDARPPGAAADGEVADVADVAAAPVAAVAMGLVCTNPPYGVRLGDAEQVQTVYRSLGDTLRRHFGGWEAAILTGAPEASRALQLRSYRTHTLWNGALECRLLRIDLANPGASDEGATDTGGLRAGSEAVADSPGAKMFANRLIKNHKRLAREAARAQVSCYRLYDADMPEYAFAIDRYVEVKGGKTHLFVQEYAPPSSIEPEAARKRRAEALAALPGALKVPREQVHLRLRRRQSGDAQYTKLADQAERHEVEEAGLRFLVNFDEYLDTGLFLDHRLTRARLRDAARDARFLNLYCYTASATVYAAAGGARSTTSIDLSNTYLDWAAENFRLNGIGRAPHVLERADCREWLQAAAGERRQFDLIFLDPPTFSNSKRMQGILDLQRDHAELIDACVRLLAPGGLLLFSTNAQRFRLDPDTLERFAVVDISAATIPFDFQRNARIHRCFEIRKQQST